MTAPRPSANAAPNRLPWPPMLFLAAVVSAAVLSLLVPLSFPDVVKAPLAVLGLVGLAAGVIFHVTAIRTLRAARTTVRPDRAASALVTDGPFRWSRNPIYLGITLGLLGLALVFEVPWVLLTAPLAALAVQELAIKREEGHLAATFPDEWASYTARVRRWF